MEVVINSCFGGFSLSHEGVMKYAELKGIKLYAWLDETVMKYTPEATLGNALFVHYSTKTKEEHDKHTELWKKTPIEDRHKLDDSGYFSCRDIDRADPLLIKTIEILGIKANGRCAELKIIEIPDDIEYQVKEYDGLEHIAEKHKTWS